MPRTTVPGCTRIIFASTIALLAAQCWFIPRYGEPYPAVTMPAFGGRGGFLDGHVALERYDAVFIAEGREFSFPPAVLLAEFPDSHHPAIADHALRPRRDVPAKVGGTSRLGRLRDATFPGYAARRTSRDSPESTASLRTWLRGRARRLLPDRPVSRVEVRWYRERIRIAGAVFHATREPAGTLVVPLDEVQ